MPRRNSVLRKSAISFGLRPIRFKYSCGLSGRRRGYVDGGWYVATAS